MIRKLVGMMSLFVMVTLVLVACGGGSGGSSSGSSGGSSGGDTQSGGVAQAPAQKVCLVPDVVGERAAAAEGKIDGSGLQMVSSSEFDSGVPKDSVISQEPTAGTRLEPCEGDVIIVVSLGPEPTPTDTPAPTDTPLPTDTPVPADTPAPTDEVVSAVESPTSTPVTSNVSGERRLPPLPAPLGWAFEQDEVQVNLVRAEIRTGEDSEAAAAQLWFTLLNKSAQKLLVEFNPNQLYILDSQGTKYVDWHKPEIESFWLEQGEMKFIDRYYSSFPGEQTQSRIPPSAFPVFVHIDALSRMQNVQWVLGDDPVKVYDEDSLTGAKGTALDLGDFQITLTDLEIRTTEQSEKAALHAWFSVKNTSTQRKLLDIDYAYIYTEDNFGNRYIDWEGGGFMSTWIDPGKDYEFDRYYTTERHLASRVPNNTDYVVVICEGIGDGQRVQWRVDIAR